MGAELLSLETPPSAIFAGNDEMAAGVYTPARGAGRVRHVAQREEDAEQANRHVDVEDPAPVGVGDDEARSSSGATPTTPWAAWPPKS